VLNTDTKLTVYHDANGVFADHSSEAHDFSRDSFSLTLSSTTSYLYIGYRKPINSLFVSIGTVNTNANSFTAQYYNGSTWTALSVSDDTKGFTRSGFMTWDRNQTNQAATSINSTSLFWIRLRPSVTHSATILNGINFLFADDNDLTFEVPEITDSNHLAGKTSHVLTHVAVRNQILQSLNNKNLKKHNLTTGLQEDLNAWDLLDYNQLKQAAVFLALSKIYFNFSDQVGDKYSVKSESYYNQFKSAFEVSRLALDTNNDGIKDTAEVQASGFNVIRMTR
jgi:hypothetical protein